MRLRRALLKRRVNAALALHYTSSGLTSYAGLELVRTYLVGLDLRRRIKDSLKRRLPGTDFGVVPMTLLVLALIVTGGRRIRHLRYLQCDPMVSRFCGLAQLPSDRSVTRWLGSFDAVHVD